jgi:hypothetical protein
MEKNEIITPRYIGSYRKTIEEMDKTVGMVKEFQENQFPINDWWGEFMKLFNEFMREYNARNVKSEGEK